MWRVSLDFTYLPILIMISGLNKHTALNTAWLVWIGYHELARDDVTIITSQGGSNAHVALQMIIYVCIIVEVCRWAYSHIKTGQRPWEGGDTHLIRSILA